VALLLTPAAAQQLAQDDAAATFVRQAFAHLKAIGHDDGGQVLIEALHLVVDDGICPLPGAKPRDLAAFLAAAGTRQWAREAKVRPLP
jgi:catalase